MANRHLARSIVLQTLFEWDTMHASKKEAHATLDRNINEFGGDGADRPFMEALLDGVIAKKDDIDLIITKAAPDWPLDRIAPVDRNILRLGLYELLFADRAQVPAKVAINEAIELAKTFGGESSGRFVNGVLGAVYKEIGEPGKDEQGKKKVRREDLPLEKYGGAIVYAKHDGQYYLALVHDVFGHWTLSKGHIEQDPSPEEGVKRVVKEELGIECMVEAQIGENEYVASHPEKGKLRKHVWFFIASADFEPLTLKKSGGLDDAKWFRLTDILDLNFYDDMLPIVTAAVQKLLDQARARSTVAGPGRQS
ncbi:transcription antitermination factor NusB [Candidatus Kaiserbacteria bacterium RIFCSPLOWO2_02_FULL_56_11]|uniref:Transcription antitermination protein NusB n=1 Tax=Candidatus Kaiserbacteria bacterium RIFCSPHIGHO2_02_FULL_56_30 TaxID=1798499 RepID=A0A1F6E231_9BACT|nr:MAG: transcription antitermination factor NusB [Candidatus Kaiserbacteria bacterium RIFCSPHIGHO2_02_FULL_56_30]OGG81366.1 MAG: transcription antitermination factor NusB [Candidatus Kaiserbacteria bacterium RIFCSPLOWO2_02_FULL_56_11]